MTTDRWITSQKVTEINFVLASGTNRKQLYLSVILLFTSVTLETSFITSDSSMTLCLVANNSWSKGRTSKDVVTKRNPNRVWPIQDKPPLLNNLGNRKLIVRLLLAIMLLLNLYHRNWRTVSRHHLTLTLSYVRDNLFKTLKKEDIISVQGQMFRSGTYTFNLRSFRAMKMNLCVIGLRDRYASTTPHLQCSAL